MECQKPNPNRTPMYPDVLQYDPNPNPNSSSSSLYPTLDVKDLVENLFPENYENAPSAPPLSVEETLISVPGSILHLIDHHCSVELASGDFTLTRLRQGENIVAVIASVGNDIQWPLTKDEAVVKLDSSHYFFSFPAPIEPNSDPNGSDSSMLSYGLTIASKGQEGLLEELDGVLEEYASFSVQRVDEVALDGGAVAREMAPGDLVEEGKKAAMERRCAAYWTTLAPNVEEYNGRAARLIAAGSGQLIKGILWCGDVTIERLKRGNEVLKKRMNPGEKSEISSDTLKRIKRVKKVTKMTEKVANGVLSGVIKVSGFFTGKVANSKLGKKFFGLLPGEIVLASLDGFSKVCDAFEVAGKNVMSTSSTVTTGLVSHRYGEEAAKATHEGLGAAGHAMGTAWAVFKMRKALNPKSVLKPTTLAKSAAKKTAAEMRAAKSSK